MGSDAGAATLLREVGLLPDGPVVWGRPLTTRAPGVYVVELPAPLPSAPIEINSVGRWVERLPDLRLDRVHPTSKALAARLASLWLPSEGVLYIGSTTGSIGGRVLAMARHVLGDRRPHADGQWLHALRGIERARIWWAETAAPEEYLDALLEAFAAGAAGRAARPGGVPDARPPGALYLPWANTRRPTGERQAHGLTGFIAAETAEPAPPPPGTRVTSLPPGDAEGARAEDRGTGAVRRGPRASAAPTVAGSATHRAPTRAPSGGGDARSGPGSRIEPVPMTREAYARLEVELDQARRVTRPEVVARIKAAREHGDLKENAEYHAAREEQSFLEGRVRLIEERLRHAVLIEEGGDGRVVMGSTVVIEHDGERITYAIVGSTEADPAAGRISAASPVGAALLGAVAGSEVQVKTPRGSATYRVVEVR
jgi:transcription elongation factor GreA